MNTDEMLKRTGLFWQYPVITEETFYEQNKKDKNYMGFPWATILDKNVDLRLVYQLLNTHAKPGMCYYTCCQHIYFRKLFQLFQLLNIDTVYTPHKTIGLDNVNGITVKPCPLYAANIEDKRRNSVFLNYDYEKLMEKKRDYLYTFNGAYNQSVYLTDIRPRIFKMNHPKDCYVNCIGKWHYENVVYSNKQNKEKELNETTTHKDNTEIYNNLLLNSRYSLCPSGSGPNSIRLWESLATGSIPIILADTLDLPTHTLWDEAVIRVPERDVEKIPNILCLIPEEKEKEMRKNCVKIYNDFKNNFKGQGLKKKEVEYK